MRRNQFHTMLAAIACLGMVVPPGALASQPTNLASDVALRPGGLLVGQVVDAQGAAQAGTEVSIQYGGREVVRTSTDQNGVFAAQGLRGGHYQIATDSSLSDCRLWAPNTAPPAAHDAAIVVQGQEVVRGQWGGYGGGGWMDWMRSHPYITAGIVAASVAIPVAIANSDDDSNS